MNIKAWKLQCYLTAAIMGGLSAPALAQTSTDSSGSVADLATVVVTARRIDERLQEVPISITVFNQQQIANRNLTTGSDLATYTPSLSANNRYGSESASFAIRGFTQDQNTA